MKLMNREQSSTYVWAESMQDMYSIQDQVKEEAKATLTWLKEKYRAILVMLTGDTEKTGRAVGRELHMDYVYTDLLPQDKLEQLEDFMSIQGEAEKLVCVGDGINDAPMLAESRYRNCHGKSRVRSGN